MRLLPKKQKQKLVYKLIEKIIEVIPELLEILVVSLIGTYLRWNQIIIVMTISHIIGNKIITIIIDFKKTN